MVLCMCMRCHTGRRRATARAMHTAAGSKQTPLRLLMQDLMQRGTGRGSQQQASSRADSSSQTQQSQAACAPGVRDELQGQDQHICAVRDQDCSA